MPTGEVVMNIRTYCRISATIFTAVSIAHLSRVISGWTVQVDDMDVPMAVSVIGLLVTGGLAIWGFRESRNAK
jgi:hypothetical protein